MPFNNLMDNASFNQIKLAITGLNDAGKAIFTTYGEPDYIKKSESLDAWAVDLWEMSEIPPRMSDDGSLTTGGGFPDVGSLVFRMIKLPPESVIRANPEDAERYFGGPVDLDSPDYGMHRSDTVDLIIVISGEIYARMDSGEEVLLRPGDSLVQRGTVHTWRNLSDEPCVMAAVLVGTDKP